MEELKGKQLKERKLIICKERLGRLINMRAPDVVIANDCRLFLKRYGRKYGHPFWLERFLRDLNSSIRLKLHKLHIWRDKEIEEMEKECPEIEKDKLYKA